jgi:S1-C subfamily serine protease
MTSFHMVAVRSAISHVSVQERLKDIEASASNATASRRAGKVQHSWKSHRSHQALVPAARDCFVSLLGAFLFLFLTAALMAAPGCAAAAPGTVGALLGKRADGRLFVRGIPPGQGADRAGLEVDDEILAIDGRSVQEMSQEEIRRAVRGDVGSALMLTVERGGQRRDVKIERSPILAGGPGARAAPGGGP